MHEESENTMKRIDDKKSFLAAVLAAIVALLLGCGEPSCPIVGSTQGCGPQQICTAIGTVQQECRTGTFCGTPGEQDICASGWVCGAHNVCVLSGIEPDAGMSEPPYGEESDGGMPDDAPHGEGAGRLIDLVPAAPAFQSDGQGGYSVHHLGSADSGWARLDMSDEGFQALDCRDVEELVFSLTAMPVGEQSEFAPAAPVELIDLSVDGFCAVVDIELNELPSNGMFVELWRLGDGKRGPEGQRFQIALFANEDGRIAVEFSDGTRQFPPAVVWAPDQWRLAVGEKLTLDLVCTPDQCELGLSSQPGVRRIEMPDWFVDGVEQMQRELHLCGGYTSRAREAFAPLAAHLSSARFERNSRDCRRP